MIRAFRYLLFFGLTFALGSSCKDNNPYTGECFIPDAIVNEVINMDLPSYFVLQNLGEHITLESAGNRGVFLVHYFDDAFYALERTCPYQSDNDCSYVTVDSTNLRLRCGQYQDTGFVACCGSEYQWDGFLLEGPSRCGLKAYRVSRQGNTLFINN